MFLHSFRSLSFALACFFVCYCVNLRISVPMHCIRESKFQIGKNYCIRARRANSDPQRTHVVFDSIKRAAGRFSTQTTRCTEITKAMKRKSNETKPNQKQQQTESTHRSTQMVKPFSFRYIRFLFFYCTKKKNLHHFIHRAIVSISWFLYGFCRQKQIALKIDKQKK